MFNRLEFVTQAVAEGRIAERRDQLDAADNVANHLRASADEAARECDGLRSLATAADWRELASERIENAQR